MANLSFSIDGEVEQSQSCGYGGVCYEAVSSEHMWTLVKQVAH